MGFIYLVNIMRNVEIKIWYKNIIKGMIFIFFFLMYARVTHNGIMDYYEHSC